MTEEASVESFYDDFAPDYHLIFGDWDASIEHQGAVLRRLLTEHGAGVTRVLDATCGIGTQAIGLARAGYTVTATDISRESVVRCAHEATARGLEIRTGVADVRALDSYVEGPFDAVISFDNALPHLMEEAELARAAAAIRRVLRPGGLLCASIRDYDALLADRPAGDPPRRFRVHGGERIVFQLWDWDDGDRYTLRHFILQGGGEHGWAVTERRAGYRALRRAELTAVLGAAGFEDVGWLMPAASGFYQPVVVAHAPR